MNIQSVQRNQHGGYDFVCDEGSLSVSEAPGNRHYHAILEWVAEGGVITPTPEPTLKDAQAEQLRDIRAEAQRRAEAYMSTYPDFEKLTWDAQESEARAYLLDGGAPTPTLEPISIARGMSLTILAAKVVEKADAFRVAAAALMGQRQALEDQIMTADTVEEVRAIGWPE